MRILIAVLASGLVLAAASASAAPCYIVLDRNDNVVYRDTYPPIDLSDPRNNDELRARGEHMIAMESDRCAQLQFFTGAAGSSALSVDAVVAGIPVSAGAKAVGATGAARSAPAGSTVSAPSAPSGPSQRGRSGY
ncbi:MAG TPA: hypothetical protein VMV45_07410 [Casimicrobiaceae bacterium]|nr:hypothetical protein [Casimicrobiaceae bacterium]